MVSRFSYVHSFLYIYAIPNAKLQEIMDARPIYRRLFFVPLPDPIGKRPKKGDVRALYFKAARSSA